MKVYLYVMLVFGAIEIVGRLHILSTGIVPTISKGSRVVEIIANIGMLVWTVVLLTSTY